MLIKAITLWQPWASFMALGLKENETRSWATQYRGPLAIHAAAKMPKRSDMSPEVWELAREKITGWHGWQLGKILCVVDLIKIMPTTAIIPFTNNKTEWMLGDYSPGRWVWITNMLKIFDEPIPIKDHQGLWNWEWIK